MKSNLINMISSRCFEVILFLVLSVQSTMATEPAVIEKFCQKSTKLESPEEFRQAVLHNLWEIYPLGIEFKTILHQYVRKSPDGPGLAFASASLIPFKDPSSVGILLERAMDPSISTRTRWHMIHAAPYILGLGNVWVSPGWCITSKTIQKNEIWGSCGGSFSEKFSDIAEHLLKLAKEAEDTSIGHVHAKLLREIADIPETDRTSDYWTGLGYASTYLFGTLDLKDKDLLDSFIVSENPHLTVINALCYAANRDFVKDMRDLPGDQISKETEYKILQETSDWWQEYLDTFPNGDWVPAAISGLKEKGYVISIGDSTTSISRELKKAIFDEDVITRYNSFRILNYIFGTHFDLERIYLAGKFSLGPFDPSIFGNEEPKLQRYWKDRLQ